MFGAQIRERDNFPELTEAAEAAFARLKAAATTEGAAVAAWSLVQGLSHLLLDGMLPRESAHAEYLGRCYSGYERAACGVRGSSPISRAPNGTNRIAEVAAYERPAVPPNTIAAFAPADNGTSSIAYSSQTSGA